MNDDRRVRDVGEFGLIAFLAGSLPEFVREFAEGETGIGDDAAVWQPAPGEKVVITTDSLVEGVHFRLDWTDWYSLGHKTLAVNISDLAAMGAAPKLAVITLALRGDERLQDLEAFYQGLGDLAARNGLKIAGGDIVRSPHGLAFHVTALGETKNGQVLKRSGARPGDLIGVTGTIGASAAGMRLLTRDPTDPLRQAATADLLIAAHLRPEPRAALGAMLLEEGASATMDLSDGLLGDLPKILEASGAGAEIDTLRLPVAAAVRSLFPEEWLDLALRGGEDYELLFTASEDAWPKIERGVQSAGGTVTAIGRIVAATATGPAIQIVADERTSEFVRPGAFDHFQT
jgi:thiamine-monophosphate kinase